MRKAVIGLALVLAAASAGAQDGKGYLAAGAGVSKYSIDYCDAAPSSCNDSDFAWNFRAGYFIFPWLGLEASFLDFGAGTIPGVLANPPANTVPIPTDSDIRTSAFVASLVGRVPVGPVSVVGRVGWGAVTGKFKGNAAVQDVSTGAIQYFSAENRETTGQFVYGVGLTFDFAKGWTARVDWDRTSAEDGRNPKFDVDMFTAGVGYRF
jgi:Outer membrane protein beta-barrel domain